MAALQPLHLARLTEHEHEVTLTQWQWWCTSVFKFAYLKHIQLTELSNVVIIAYAKAYDIVDPEALANAVDALGKDNVVLQIPSGNINI